MKTKLIVIWVGVILLVGMCLYPPWQWHVNIQSKTEGGGTSSAVLGKNSEYSFLLSPPPSVSVRKNFVQVFKPNVATVPSEIDFSRLGLQFLAVFPLLGAIYFTLSQLEKNKEFEALRKAAKAKEPKKEKP